MIKRLFGLWVISLVAVVRASGAEPSGQGSMLFQHCSTCHGTDGQGKQIGTARFPSIAGLDAWYVENQLFKFRESVRGAHPSDMQGLMMRAMSRALRSTNEVQQVAADGYALDREEFLPGLFCIAVLVPGSEGRASNTGIAIQAPSLRLSPEQVPKVLPALRRAAKALARIDTQAVAAA